MGAYYRGACHHRIPAVGRAVDLHRLFARVKDAHIPGIFESLSMLADSVVKAV